MKHAYIVLTPPPEFELGIPEGGRKILLSGFFLLRLPPNSAKLFFWQHDFPLRGEGVTPLAVKSDIEMDTITETKQNEAFIDS